MVSDEELWRFFKTPEGGELVRVLRWQHQEDDEAMTAAVQEYGRENEPSIRAALRREVIAPAPRAGWTSRV